MNNTKKYKILVVDDEEDICEILQFNLSNVGFEVDKAFSAEEAMTLMPDKYDLLLLDIMMGNVSGYQLANKIRNELNSNVPIIFLTAKNTENDILTGFSLGADDYITKPFSVQEVIARVKAVFRRTSKDEVVAVEKNIVIDNLEIDMLAKTVRVNGKLTTLTKKEYLILVMLCNSPNKYFSRQQILDKVWSNESFVLERSVDVHITHLRKKIGTESAHIVSRPGFGYCYQS